RQPPSSSSSAEAQTAAVAIGHIASPRLAARASQPAPRSPRLLPTRASQPAPSSTFGSPLPARQHVLVLIARRPLSLEPQKFLARRTPVSSAPQVTSLAERSAVGVRPPDPNFNRHGPRQWADLLSPRTSAASP
ncbi:hypothetical protein OC844_006207, partial [Tilletia horrida]